MFYLDLFLLSPNGSRYDLSKKVFLSINPALSHQQEARNQLQGLSGRGADKLGWAAAPGLQLLTAERSLLGSDLRTPPPFLGPEELQELDAGLYS